MSRGKSFNTLVQKLIDETNLSEEEVIKLLKECNVDKWALAYNLINEFKDKIVSLIKVNSEEMQELKEKNSVLQNNDSEYAYSERAKLAIKIAKKKGSITCLKNLTIPIKKMIGRYKVGNKPL